MTTLLPRIAGALPRAWSIGEPRVLRGVDGGQLLDFAHHYRLHGPLRSIDLAELIALCGQVNLTGRGGAGFPVARKLSGLIGARRPVVVVNLSESEPASAKDRLIGARTPHLILDGAAVVAAAIAAQSIEVAVQEPAVARAMIQAVANRPPGPRTRVTLIEGGFVAGEARALIRALNGGDPVPPGRRTLPTQRGVRGAPTFVSNAETFAQLAVLVRLGASAFAAVGTGNEPGTQLLTVGGCATQPGVVETPIGVRLGDVLAQGGVRDPVAVVVGGYHGTWIAADPTVALSRAGLSSLDARLGAGVIVALDARTCLLAELSRVARWLAAQSAGQCGPCALGLPALADGVADLLRGRRDAAATARRHLAQLPGRGACAHPDGAVRFVASGLELLRGEIDLHARHGSCGRALEGQLPLAWN